MPDQAVEQLGYLVGRELYKVLVEKYIKYIGEEPTSNGCPVTQTQFGNILKDTWVDTYTKRASKDARNEWSRLEKHTLADLWKTSFRGGTPQETLGFRELIGLFVSAESGVPPTPEEATIRGGRDTSAHMTDSFSNMERLLDMNVDGAVLTNTAQRRVKMLEKRCRTYIELLKESDSENTRLSSKLQEWTHDRKAAQRLFRRENNDRLEELEEERAHLQKERQELDGLRGHVKALEKALSDAKAKARKFAKLAKDKGRGRKAVAMFEREELEASRPPPPKLRTKKAHEIAILPAPSPVVEPEPEPQEPEQEAEVSPEPCDNQLDEAIHSNYTVVEMEDVVLNQNDVACDPQPPTPPPGPRAAIESPRGPEETTQMPAFPETGGFGEGNGQRANQRVPMGLRTQVGWGPPAQPNVPAWSGPNVAAAYNTLASANESNWQVRPVGGNDASDYHTEEDVDGEEERAPENGQSRRQQLSMANALPHGNVPSFAPPMTSSAMPGSPRKSPRRETIPLVSPSSDDSHAPARKAPKRQVIQANNNPLPSPNQFPSAYPAGVNALPGFRSFPGYPGGLGSGTPFFPGGFASAPVGPFPSQKIAVAPPSVMPIARPGPAGAYAPNPQPQHHSPQISEIPSHMQGGAAHSQIFIAPWNGQMMGGHMGGHMMPMMGPPGHQPVMGHNVMGPPMQAMRHVPPMHSPPRMANGQQASQTSGGHATEFDRAMAQRHVNSHNSESRLEAPPARPRVPPQPTAGAAPISWRDGALPAPRASPEPAQEERFDAVVQPRKEPASEQHPPPEKSAQWSQEPAAAPFGGREERRAEAGPDWSTINEAEAGELTSASWANVNEPENLQGAVQWDTHLPTNSAPQEMELASQTPPAAGDGWTAEAEAQPVKELTPLPIAGAEEWSADTPLHPIPSKDGATKPAPAPEPVPQVQKQKWTGSWAALAKTQAVPQPAATREYKVHSLPIVRKAPKPSHPEGPFSNDAPPVAANMNWADVEDPKKQAPAGQNRPAGAGWGRHPGGQNRREQRVYNGKGRTQGRASNNGAQDGAGQSRRRRGPQSERNH